MAHHRNDDDDEEGNNTAGNQQDLDKYELWTVIKEQVRILRDEMDPSTRTSSPEFSSDTLSPTLSGYDGSPAKYVNMSTNQEDILDHSNPQDRYSRAIPMESITPQELRGESMLQHFLGGMTISSVFDFADKDTGLSVAFGRRYGSMFQD
jgi:hypothetical protein